MRKAKDRTVITKHINNILNSGELLKDIDKDTVSWAPNFDDTELESAISTANSSGETIVVQSNFVLYETLKIDSSVNITLDLNGFEVDKSILFKFVL